MSFIQTSNWQLVINFDDFIFFLNRDVFLPIDWINFIFPFTSIWLRTEIGHVYTLSHIPSYEFVDDWWWVSLCTYISYVSTQMLHCFEFSESVYKTKNNNKKYRICQKQNECLHFSSFLKCALIMKWIKIYIFCFFFISFLMIQRKNEKKRRILNPAA